MEIKLLHNLCNLLTNKKKKKRISGTEHSELLSTQL